MRRKSLAAVILAFAALTGSTIWSFLPSPLPPPTPWSAALPVALPPPITAIFQLPTGTYQTPAALAFRGGSFFETRDFASTAVLLRHPKGDLLFDAGFGSALDAHIAMLPWFQRTQHNRGETVRAQLASIGYDFGALRGVVITHSHWDHVSGLADLAAPVWMNAAEQRYANEDHAVTRAFRSFSGLNIRSYGFEGPAYLGFPSSYDVWGDGSIVLVPAPGHTPGSIVAFSSYAAYAQRQIFDPLEMTHTHATSLEPGQDGMAQGYRWWFGWPLHAQDKFSAANLPAGYITSTADDLSHYLIAQLNDGRYRDKTLLSAKSLALMRTVSSAAQLRGAGGAAGYGLG